MQSRSGWCAADTETPEKDHYATLDPGSDALAFRPTGGCHLPSHVKREGESCARSERG